MAYCAPGRRLAAAIALALKGEQVAQIKEHPWLQDGAYVLVAGEPPELLADAAAFSTVEGGR